LVSCLAYGNRHRKSRENDGASQKGKGYAYGKGSLRVPGLHCMELPWAFDGGRKGQVGESNNKGWSGNFSVGCRDARYPGR